MLATTAGAGILGGIVAGFLAGYVVKLLNSSIQLPVLKFTKTDLNPFHLRISNCRSCNDLLNQSACKALMDSLVNWLNTMGQTNALH